MIGKTAESTLYLPETKKQNFLNKKGFHHRNSPAEKLFSRIVIIWEICQYGNVWQFFSNPLFSATTPVRCVINLYLNLRNVLCLVLK